MATGVAVFLHAEQSGEIKGQVTRGTIRGFSHFYCRSRLARIIARFYVISPSHKTELLPCRKKCTPPRRSSRRAARLAGPKMRCSAGEPYHPPPGRPVSAKTAKKPARNPIFSAEITGTGLTFALFMVIAWNLQAGAP
jgi:hypothetical protein